MNYDDIKSPQDIKRLDISELGGVADYLRHRIICAVQVSGGHLSSNLGTVELRSKYSVRVRRPASS